MAKVDAQQKCEHSVTCTTCKKNKGKCNQQTGERHAISEDGGKDAFMNDASIVNKKGFQWKLIFMVLTIIFILKGTLSWK